MRKENMISPSSSEPQDSSSPSIPKPSIPWKVRLAITFLSSLTDLACRPDGTVNRRLLRFLDIQAPPNPNPINSVSSSDIKVDPTRDLWIRLFSPSGSLVSDYSNLPVLVFFHGGGFAFLTPSSKAYDAVCRRFARKIPAFVISVNYRRTPEHRYPAQFDDGYDVLKFLDENRQTVLPKNADLSRCFLAGDSAGANIAHHVAVRACQSGFQTMKVIGLVSIQPFFGGEERTDAENRLVGSGLLVSVPRTDWCWRAFLPSGSNRDHAATNVSGPNAEDISGLEFPRTLVFVGGFDPLQDWQRRYQAWLKKSGKEATLIEYPNMTHAFYVFPELPEAAKLIMQVKEFIDSCITDDAA